MIKVDYLSKETSTNIKGIFAIIILLGHLKNNTPLLVGTMIGNLISVWAYLVVGGFFFFSGYGLYLQYSNQQENYIRNFPVKRMLPLYVSCIIFSLIYILRDIVIKNLNFLNVIKAIFIPGSGISFGWYIEATFIVYLFFWVLFSVFPKLNKVLGFSIISVLYLAIAILFLSQLWVQSFGGFILGFIWCKCKEKIDKLLSKKSIHIISTVCSLITFLFTFYFGNLNSIEDTLGSKIALFVSTIAFIISILLTINFISINNPITHWLGSISLEIYCLHGLIIDLCSSFKINDTYPIVFLFLVILATLFFSFALNILIKKVHCTLKIK